MINTLMKLLRGLLTGQPKRRVSYSAMYHKKKAAAQCFDLHDPSWMPIHELPFRPLFGQPTKSSTAQKIQSRHRSSFGAKRVTSPT